jgi:ABC-type nitrate/sulfonate/bicarbonate transport system substrate-binding protein
MVFSKVFRNPGRLKGRLSLVLGFILLAALAGLCSIRGRDARPPPEKIAVGIVATDNAGLVYIASELGLFSKYGVDASLKEYEAGSSIMEDLEQGKLDFAATSEFALVREGFRRNDLEAVASIALSDNIRFIGRRDRDIESPADLKGKTIGVLQGTSCEFFLATFLAFSGILDREVRIVNIKPSDAASGILSKNIDAAMLWDPYAYRLTAALGKNGIVWDGQSGQDYYVLLISTRQFVDGHAPVVENALKALAEAERFAESNPAAAKKIVRRRLGYDNAYSLWAWTESSLKLCLTQDLLIHMEDEGRWFRKKGMYGTSGMPNYYADMYLDGLEKVDPDAVSIIH